jgi:DNA-binding NarL/FixJ family response regulator
MIRLLCVDDDPLIRDYLTVRLQAEPDLHLIGAVADLQRARIFLCREEIDVLLLDYHLHGQEGTQLVQAMCPWTRWSLVADDRPRVLFCTGFADAEFRAKARLLGARGVVAKERIAPDLIPAIRCVAQGGSWYEADTAAGTGVIARGEPAA